MQQIVLFVRRLRSIALFKVSTRMVVITLMLLGVWVATQKLDMPSVVSINDKFIHVVVFFSFAFLVDLSSSRAPFWLWKGFPLFTYGVGIEVAQYFTPFRSFSIMDMFANLSGIVIYFLGKQIILYIVKTKDNESKIL